MCGIYGAVMRDPAAAVDADVLARMDRVLAHRGPDGRGEYVDGPLGMGMRRLSIIDLATGDQPIANEDGSVWVVFNGEIYNYRELTAALRRAGHRFRTASDTEVLVHLWEDEGPRCVQRLRGMFAFAIWDRRAGTLFLARDRLGIKPLYYADTPDGFVFASELKAVLQHPGAGASVDPRAVRAYLQYGYVPDPGTIMAGVAKLPPAHTLVVRDGRPARPLRYWRITGFFHERLRGIGDEDATQRLAAVVEDAVRSHLMSDVPLGAFLSGGADSTTVVCMMTAAGHRRPTTFSVGFEDDPRCELPYARQVAEWFGTDHHELLVGPADLGLLEDVLAALDEPFADPSAIPTYLVARLARRHVTVVLSGDGGDEIFAGYDRYRVDHRRRHLGRLGDLGLGAPLRHASRRLPEGAPGKNYLYNLSLPRMQRYVDSVALFPPRILGDVLHPDVLAGDAPGVEDTLEASDGLDALSRLQDFDLHTYLPGDILTKVDRMTMANSLEARVPLLDHRLVEFACSLPPRLRMRAGTTKYVLRRLLGERVPEAVLRRPKQGFAPPLEAWFSGRLPGFFADSLADTTTLASVGIRPAAVRRLVGLYARLSREDHCRRLWALTVLNRAVRRLSAMTTAAPACASVA